MKLGLHYVISLNKKNVRNTRSKKKKQFSFHGKNASEGKKHDVKCELLVFT